jgi:uncharacterized protein
LHHLKRAKLKLVNQYIIPFTGLKEGDHEFAFDLGKKFFDAHDLLDAQDGNVKANVSLNKKPNMLSLKIALKGAIKIQCDRCLEYYPLPITYMGDLVVKFGEETEASTDEIWILDPNENTLDLEQYFFECIGICIPIQRIHPENKNGQSGCDPAMIEMIKVHSRPEDRLDESDPRWSKLKDLLNNLNIY